MRLQRASGAVVAASAPEGHPDATNDGGAMVGCQARPATPGRRSAGDRAAEQTARLIPDCTLRMYEGKGHEGRASDKRFARDVLDFVRQRPAMPRERGQEPEVIPGEPVGTAAG